MKITIRKTIVQEVVLDLPFCAELSVADAMEVAEAYDPKHFTYHDSSEITEGKWVAVKINHE